MWPHDVLPDIRAAQDARRPLVVLDDDPTGTQTVRDIAVVTQWDVPALRDEFARHAAGFYILTNSRSLPPVAARALNLEIARNLRSAAGDLNLGFTLASRSDSTLRGHFPLETDALAEAAGPFDLTLVAPYFEAGGRLTIGDVHYVAEGDQLTPAAETPFARDPAFGFRNSNLRAWIEEKTAGRVRARDVASLSLELIRKDGPDGVTNALLALPPRSYVIANAAAPADIEVVAMATLRAEARGRTLLLRTAAALVAARLGIRPEGCLGAADFAGTTAATGGLVVVGSYVPKTTEQLARLRAAQAVTAIELDVRAVLDRDRAAASIASAASNLGAALGRGENVVLFTSRNVVTAGSAEDSLGIGAAVSRALIAVVQSLRVQPRFLIAKGGITSSDVATLALGVRRARVRGQLLPGVPVWQLGPETRFPGLDYVVFPGNVGDANALARAVAILSATSATTAPVQSPRRLSG